MSGWRGRPAGGGGARGRRPGFGEAGPDRPGMLSGNAAAWVARRAGERLRLFPHHAVIVVAAGPWAVLRRLWRCGASAGSRKLRRELIRLGITRHARHVPGT